MISSISNFLLVVNISLDHVEARRLALARRGPRNVSPHSICMLRRSTGSPKSICLGFINSAYRFVLKPSVTADYTVHFVDPDMYVWLRFAHLFPGIDLLISYFQWSDIVQILVPHAGSSATGEGNTMCPICLGAPIAPRMTKCGHVSLHST
jgi:hypothetical protein